MTHRVGIIGLGTVGARFVEQFALHPSFELASAWDPDPAACTAQQHAVAIADGPDDVIESADVVYIAVPPLFHREYVDACIAADTAIFCEKPLGIDVVESRRLVELITGSGLPAGVNFVFGGAPSATGLLASVTAGDLGEVIRCDLRFHFAEWPRAWHRKAQWLRLRDQGGWTREVGSHFLFLAARLLGPLSLEHVAVTFPDGPDGVLSEREVLARFGSDRVPLLLIGTSEGMGPDIVELTLRGSRQSLRIVDWYRLQSSDGGEWVDVSSADRATLGQAAYRSQLDQLALLLAGEANSIATFGEALAVQELIETMLAPRSPQA